MPRMLAALLPSLPLLAAAATARCDVPPSYGWDFVTVGAVGNAAWEIPYSQNLGGASTLYAGRPVGSVGYEYRISRTELRTEQWMQFLNTFSMSATPPLGSWSTLGPNWWGARADPAYSGPGVRWVLGGIAGAADMPVSGISWRSAALYCNWLHNGQLSDPASLVTGAYDVSTWGSTDGGLSFTDGLSHLPGARYWIPTIDEWTKATYYDPNRFGTGQGGYWTRPNGRDTSPVYGPPGEGEANSGFIGGAPGAEWLVPVGSYPNVTSPWGLLDTAGGASEWTEYAWGGATPLYRALLGSEAALPPISARDLDQIGRTDMLAPSFSDGGLRIASAVPGPATLAPMLVASAWCSRRRCSPTVHGAPPR